VNFTFTIIVFSPASIFVVTK